MYAAVDGKTSEVRRLLDEGAPVNYKGELVRWSKIYSIHTYIHTCLSLPSLPSPVASPGLVIVCIHVGMVVCRVG